MTPQPLRLVIFDCDGVLIDSEPASRQVLADEAKALGFPMHPDEAKIYTGFRLSDLQPVFEARFGRVLPESWPADVQQKMVAAMSSGVAAVPGVEETLDAVVAMGLKLRVASNSSHEEMAEKFDRTGLTERLAGRIHSARDVAKGKPSPELFLAAAAAEGVPPEACLVVEDSRPGIMAASAAGMACVAYAPEGLPADLAGFARPIASLPELVPIVRAAMMDRAA